MRQFVFSPKIHALWTTAAFAMAISSISGFTHAQPWSLPSSLYSSYYLPGLTAASGAAAQTGLPGAGLGSVETRGFASKSVLGWRPSNYYGAEIGYQPLPESVFQPFGASPALRYQAGQASMPVTVNAYAPLSTRAELTGRLGYLLNSGQGSDRYCFDAAGRAYGCQSAPLTFGLGVRYELRERFGLRMDYDFLDLRDTTPGARARSSFFSLGADYRY
jgi:hypothetical protein